MTEFTAFLSAHRSDLLHQALEHLWLTLVALLLAVAIAVPGGVWLTRHPRAERAALGVAGVIQTIPSLALLGFLLPATGIGAPPAIVALFLYALLPIVRNTVSGVRSVDPAVKDAAIGMGMADSQVLRKVELPLALPILFAGIRTATVINVGIATLCALIGAGGLGVYIFRGISLNNPTMVLAGALPAAVLALTLDALLGLAERHVTRWAGPLLGLAVAFVLGTAAYQAWERSVARSRFTIGVPAEFMERADGYPGLEARYALEAQTLEIEHGLMYQALRNGDVDAAIGYSTDGEIAAFHLEPMIDDRRYFPPYAVAPIARGAALRQHPELRKALGHLDGALDEATMAGLNARVEHGRESAAAVAMDYLARRGLPVGKRRRVSHGAVRIGSKIFAEQYILAELYAQLIENLTTLSVSLHTGLGGTKICFDALANGEIDVYPEYSGTGLLAILDVPPAVSTPLLRRPGAVYDFVKKRFREQFDILWLEPHGFENTYAVILTAERAKELGVRNLSELSQKIAH